MKGKILAVAVLVMLAAGLLLNSRPAQASNHAVLAIDNVFAALNSGQAERAVALFADDAIAQNLLQAETYNGASEILQMLQGMQREGRRLDVVAVQMDGDTITAQVEVSDSGHVWGTETIEAKMNGDKLQSFTVVAFRLELWRIGR